MAAILNLADGGWRQAGLVRQGTQRHSGAKGPNPLTDTRELSRAEARVGGSREATQDRICHGDNDVELQC